MVGMALMSVPTLEKLVPIDPSLASVIKEFAGSGWPILAACWTAYLMRNNRIEQILDRVESLKFGSVEAKLNKVEKAVEQEALIIEAHKELAAIEKADIEEPTKESTGGVANLESKNDDGPAESVQPLQTDSAESVKNIKTEPAVGSVESDTTDGSTSADPARQSLISSNETQADDIMQALTKYKTAESRWEKESREYDDLVRKIKEEASQPIRNTLRADPAYFALLQEEEKLKSRLNSFKSNAQFGRIYNSLTREQLQLLKLLNVGPLPIVSIEKMNENRNRTLHFWASTEKFADTWLKFLESFNLVKTVDGLVVLTGKGKEFLRFLLDNGYPLDK